MQRVNRLGLHANTEVRVGRSIWGAVRPIDVVATHPQSRARLGVECKYQGSGDTAEEKIPASAAVDSDHLQD
ncbi:MAG: hypothetical protein QHJ73_11180 [Armatimonadota bacterium]|nr:hypothetical protein [Armatimonadota bacterium]